LEGLTHNFRILSLDGGGVRGYLTAGVLAQVEAHLNRATGEDKPLGRRFDLICGTSTGAIIALGLVAGKSANEIKVLYEELLSTVFARRARRSLFAWLFRPRYCSTALKAELERFFGTISLESNELVCDVCVTAVALTTGRPKFYKTDYMARNAARLSEKLSDVALGASAAPTFFAVPSLRHGELVADGGLCCNNPAMVAIVEARQFERVSRRGTPPPTDLGQVCMLSVGTGEQSELPFAPERAAHAGLAFWARNFPELAIASQVHAAHFQASFLLRDNYHRFNPSLKARMRLDDVSKINVLKNHMDMDSACERFVSRHLV
jgi:predicted acylesterase/phospholipase RssA